MAPFYRVFANTLGTGPWFDTWISEPSPGSRTAGAKPVKVLGKMNPLIAGLLVVALDRGGTAGSCSGRVRTRSTSPPTFPRTVSLYEGSEVKILGVAVGKVEDGRAHRDQRHGEVLLRG